MDGTFPLPETGERDRCQDDGSTLHLYYYGEEGISKGAVLSPHSPPLRHVLLIPSVT